MLNLVSRILKKGRAIPERLHRGLLRPWLLRRGLGPQPRRVNLCSGDIAVAGYMAIDLLPGRHVEVVMNLQRGRLPFANESLEVVVCMSAINYFTYERAAELIRETYRVLQPGGIARFGVQDLRLLAKRYLERDLAFFGQKLGDGRDRFPGATLGDKFAQWFYGFAIAGHPCRYVFDYDSLAHLFHAAGFTVVEQRAYRDSRLPEVEQLDNRPEQMFYLEAVKCQ